MTSNCRFVTICSISILNVTCVMQVMLVTRARRHLHQRGTERKNASSSIGKHFGVKRSYVPNDLTKNFTILKKCKNKFDCLNCLIFFFNELRPSLHVQSDSICAKVFNILNYVILAVYTYTFAKKIYLHFWLDNDRSSVETSLLFTVSFYFK